MAPERSRRVGTIRSRTTAVAVAIVAIALVAGSVVLLGILHRQLVANTDASLRARLDDLQALTRQGALPAVLPSTGDDGTVAQITLGGSVVAASANVAPGRLLTRAAPPGSATQIGTVAHPPVGDGTAYRVAVRAFGDRPGTVGIAAASLEPVNETVGAVRTGLLVGVPAMVVLLALVTWHSLGRALAPVERMRRSVAEISMSALDQRVPEPAVGDEIGRLARTMNQMLGRLETAAARQRAFVADASHELRSPLASIQTQLDVALAQPATTDWLVAARNIVAESERLRRMVDDLLFLAARDERGAPPTGDTMVDLDEIILVAAQSIRGRRRVGVDVSGVTGGRVRGDPAGLERMVVNLLDNAERHAATTVTVELHQTDSSVELVVTDDGPGIPSEDRERIFERFARLDEARSRRLGGAGLGLAIVRDVVVGAGGSIAVAEQPSGSRFVVRLPTGT